MKIIKEAELKGKILDALVSTLKEIPFIKIRKKALRPARKSGYRPDALIEVEVGEDRQKRLLVIEVKNNGEPRLVRDAINQLLRYQQLYPGAYKVVGAPYISPTSAKLCAEQGDGYIDLAGNCRLAFEQVYIVREGAKNPFAEKRDLRTLYSPRATRLLRVLLSDPKRLWKTVLLAEEADVSIGQVSNVRKLLKNREWLYEDKSGFRLLKPAQLLEEWTENYTFRKNEVKQFYCLANIAEIERKVAAECSRLKVPFALTGLAGAARVTPGTRYQKTMAYIEKLSPQLLARNGLKEVPSGSNVSLLVPYDSGVFYEAKEYDGIPVVSAVQLYLDLKNFKGRGEEAAQNIYDKVLGASW